MKKSIGYKIKFFSLWFFVFRKILKNEIFSIFNNKMIIDEKQKWGQIPFLEPIPIFSIYPKLSRAVFVLFLCQI